MIKKFRGILILLILIFIITAGCEDRVTPEGIPADGSTPSYTSDISGNESATEYIIYLEAEDEEPGKSV